MGYIPTGECRNCERSLTFDVKAGQWQDNLGWYICPIDNHRGHWPINPIEGIDY